MSITDGQVCATNELYGDACNTSYNWYISCKGDSFRLCTPRVPGSANAQGFAGQWCWGVDGGQAYLYICVDTNTWTRVALNTW